GGSGLAGAVGFYIAAYSVASVLFILLLYPVVAVFGRIAPHDFARAALSAQLIAFSSSSSTAALPALVEGAEQGLRLPKNVTGFVLPLAVSTFKFAAPVPWSFGAPSVAWSDHIPLHVVHHATIAFATVTLWCVAPW